MTAIANEVGIPPDQVAYSLIGASWGGQITERALIALAVFMVLVALVIGIYFRDAKMSAAALIGAGSRFDLDRSASTRSSALLLLRRP